MRTKTEQEESRGEELRAIAAAIRGLEARAKSAGETTLAYLLDMAALEADSRARSGGAR